MVAVLFQKPLHHLAASMRRKSQMPYPSVFLLFFQVCIDPVFFLIQIGIDIHLTDIVEQIKIKIFHAALFKLFFKGLLHLRHIGKIIPRKLCGKIKAVSLIF